MKLRAVLEVEVPDEVGSAMLDEQARRQALDETVTLTQIVHIDDHRRYQIAVPLVWIADE